MIDLQSKITSTPENLLIIVSRIHTANQETILKKIQEVKWFVKLLHDEANNTTLGGGGLVKLDEQWEQ
jgi:hypothetical protein